MRLIGVEAAGECVGSGKHSATLVAGRPGVLHGTRTYLLQDEAGNVLPTHSISAGLDYPAVGPEHAALHDAGRVRYAAASDSETLAAFHLLCRLEGILPALESAHAISAALDIARTSDRPLDILVNLSGRGDKDLETVLRHLRAEDTP